jgi:putative ABC transport system permease protein
MDGFLRRRFAANATLIGKALDMRLAATLVGVLPADFQLHFAPDAHVPADVQAFIPFPYDIYAGSRDVYYIRLIARLRPGVSISQAQRDLDRVAAEIRGAYTDYNSQNLRFSLTGMQADAVRDLRPALTALFAGASALLLICCVNVTSLLLARATDRRKEIALRLAIGASRGRIVCQLLIEAGVLCLLGGAGGIATGWAGFRVLLAIRPERLARIGDAGLHWPLLAFAVAVSLAPLCCSVWPPRLRLPSRSHRKPAHRWSRLDRRTASPRGRCFGDR